MLRTYLLSLISSGIIRDEQSMQDFFSKTFWAYQFEDMDKLDEIMGRMLLLLEEWEFVKVANSENNNGFVSADQLNNQSNKKLLRPTLLGKRVSELYLDPLTARHLLDSLKNYNQNKNSFSLLQMICHTLEMRPLLRIKVKEQDKIQEALVKNYHFLLKEEPSAYDLEYSEFMNSIKTTLFFNSWIDEKDEDYLMENFHIRPGEIRMKLETADWLLYGCEEMSKILDYKDTIRDLRKLRVRVKNGVREDLLLLLKLKSIGRVRARKLVNNGLKNLGDIKKIDLASLSQIIGNKLAIDVKKQLGEEVKEIPKGTRKGQLSIAKF